MKRLHKNLRKVLAIVLICAMLTMSMGAYSGDVSQQDTKEVTAISGNKINELLEKSDFSIDTTVNLAELNSKATAEVALINNVGISADYINEINILNNNDLVYVYHIGDIISQINIEQNNNYISYEIQEGNLVNTLDIYFDGSIFVDGQLISSASKYSLDIPIQRGYVERYWSDICPYEVASDYNDYQEYIEVADIEFNETFENLALSAISIILCAFLPSYIGAASALIMLVAGEMKEEYPYSSHASYKSYVYYHGEDGYFIADPPPSVGALGVEKHSMYFYGEEDFKGEVIRETWYYCHEII